MTSEEHPPRGEAWKEPLPGDSPQRRARPELPKNFRKLTVEERRKTIETVLGGSSGDFASTGESKPLVELADVLVESASGYFAVPVGIVDGLVVDGRRYAVPLATEEPSVVAAATYGARIVASAGGFSTWSDEPITTGTLYLEARAGLEAALQAYLPEARAFLESSLIRMTERGGGLRSIRIDAVADFLRISFDVDVRDAMGANVVNTAAELLAGEIERRLGVTVVMAILSNESSRRRAGASFSIEVSTLPANDRFDRPELARRVCLASRIAEADPMRAVTHNKGIMNGITALALATGNDTRGIEAAAHAWAARGGSLRPLSSYRIDGSFLHGSIELPLPFATVGGAVSFHPAARAHLEILGVEHAVDLSRIAAATGLAQNFAALLALVGGGIQRGHMRLHERRRTLARGEAR
jgi:hydroxymethylglutaryl-CoA reductase